MRRISQLNGRPIRRHNMEIIDEFPLVALGHLRLAEKAVGFGHLAPVVAAGTPLAAGIVIPVAKGHPTLTTALNTSAELKLPIATDFDPRIVKQTHPTALAARNPLYIGFGQTYVCRSLRARWTSRSA